MEYLSGPLSIAVAVAAATGFWAGYNVARNLPSQSNRKNLLPFITAIVSVAATVSVTYVAHLLLH